LEINQDFACIYRARFINSFFTGWNPMILKNPSLLRVVFPWALWKGPSDRREIALTFDDGPHPEHTPETLDILRSHGAKAVFFLNGRNVLLFPGMVERLKSEGHVAATHGFSHRRLDFRKRDFVVGEIEAGAKAVEKTGGKKPAFFRPPYGRFDPRFKAILRERNMTLVLWSLLTCDFREPDPDALRRTVRDRIHNGAILVFHDGHRNAPVMLKALPDILETVRQLGYGIATLEAWTG
jgi:peptidoglycan-N-acetylglucosamine deacetylase